MSCYTLPHINDFIIHTREKRERETQNCIKRIENTYLAIQLLAAEGIFIEPTEWQVEHGWTSFEVKFEDLNAIRRALGCRLEEGDREPVEKTRNKVWQHMIPTDEAFRHLKFKYKTKLPEGAKCKIVTQRQHRTYRTLVCEA